MTYFKIKSIHTRSPRNLFKFHHKASYLDSDHRASTILEREHNHSTLKSAHKSAFAFCLYSSPWASAWPRKPLDGPSSRLPQIPVGYTYSTTTIDCPPLFNIYLQMRGLRSGYKLISSIEYWYRNSIVSFKHKKQRSMQVKISSSNWNAHRFIRESGKRGSRWR